MFLHYIEPIHTHIACILTSPDLQFIHKLYNPAEWISRIQFYETFKKIYRSGFSMWAPSKIFINVLKCFGNYLNTQMDLNKSQEISYAHFVFCCGLLAVNFTHIGYGYSCHQMETFPVLLTICAGNWPITGELPVEWPVTPSWWFETPSRPLWRHCNVHWQWDNHTCVTQR